MSLEFFVGFGEKMLISQCYVILKNCVLLLTKLTKGSGEGDAEILIASVPHTLCGCQILAAKFLDLERPRIIYMPADVRDHYSRRI